MNKLMNSLLMAVGVMTLGLALRSGAWADDCYGDNCAQQVTVTDEGAYVNPIPSSVATQLPPEGTVGTISGSSSIMQSGSGFYVTTPQYYVVNYGGWSGSVATGATDVRFYYAEADGGYSFIY